MEKWKKIGLIAEPRKIKINWWKSFGMDPCTIHLKIQYIEFFCGRNNKNISLIGSFDVDLKIKKYLIFQKNQFCYQVNLELLMIMVLQHHVY